MLKRWCSGPCIADDSGTAAPATASSLPVPAPCLSDTSPTHSPIAVDVARHRRRPPRARAATAAASGRGDAELDPIDQALAAAAASSRLARARRWGPGATRARPAQRRRRSPRAVVGGARSSCSSSVGSCSGSSGGSATARGAARGTVARLAGNQPLYKYVELGRHAATGLCAVKGGLPCLDEQPSSRAAILNLDDSPATSCSPSSACTLLLSYNRCVIDTVYDLLCCRSLISIACEAVSSACTRPLPRAVARREAKRALALCALHEAG